VGNGTCVSQSSAPASIIVSPKPAKPVITPSGTTNLCDGSSVTLSAPAGFTYAWSTGQTTQDITITMAGSYSVTVTDGSGCPSDASNPIEVKTFTTPSKPTIDIFGSTTLCGTNTVGLLAPSGFSIYQWSGGQITQGFNVSAAGTFSVIVGNAANCLSIASDVITVTSTGQPCTTTGGINSPPVIIAETLSVQIEGRLEEDLTPFLSDPDNNLDFSSLRVINNETSKGVSASIDAAYNLIIDYAGNPFTGEDRVTIEICDLAGSCAQQFIDIDVVGGVEVFNAVTPDGDGFNDFLFIKYVDVVEGASKNKVVIFNRWGDVVFNVDDYDNLSRIFSGQTNSGKDLTSGTYFYKIDFSKGESITGFITLKR
jgi:gliding motility-associated-like protein